MQRKTYVRPTIIRNITGLAKKHGMASAMRAKTRIDGIRVADLVAEYGSPLFVFSERSIRKTYKEAERAFASRYPHVRFAWSYKTNYLDAVCRIFHQEGALAEVVSEFEYEMARNNGVPGEDIIYNGPYKPGPALERAVREGARVNLDNFDELYLLEKIVSETKKTFDVGLRVNLSTGPHPAWGRFGFNLENGEAMNAARRLHAGGMLGLSGLHCHIGTFVTDTDAYGLAAKKLARFALDLEKELGTVIKTLDLGGGFASRNTLHSQYAEGADVNPTMEDYASALTPALLEAGFSRDRLPRLILETGRALIDEAGTLITSVVANKKMPTGQRAVVVDAGVGVLFTAFWYKLGVVPAVDRPGRAEDTVVNGPLCMNIDVVRPSVKLPPMDPGDPLLVHPAGAYNLTQWMQFIRMRPAVVMVGENQEIGLIRKAETIDAIKTHEQVPEWLENKGEEEWKSRPRLVSGMAR